MKKESQNKQILAYLQKGNSITPLSALSLFGCLRLSGRIYDLRNAGYNIRTNIIERDGKKFASYSLPDNLKKNVI